MAKKKETKQQEQVVVENRFAEFEALFASGTITRLKLIELAEEFFGSDAVINFVDARQFSVEVKGNRIPEEGHLIVCK